MSTVNHDWSLLPDPALCGWIGELAEPEFARLADRFVPFRFVGSKMEKPGPPIWEFAKRVNGGQHLPRQIQAVGDCVSFGVAQAGKYLACFQRAILGRQEEYHEWFPPYIYGISRCAPECGNGRLGGGDGSLGSWGAIAVQKYGVLFSDDQGVPKYSGSVARQWGRNPGPPADMKALARDNPVKSAARVTTVDEVRDALMNYCPCTFACAWSYSNEAKVEKDRAALVDTGRVVGGHQVCLLDWRDDPFPAAYLLNSWPIEYKQFWGEPPGGAWLRAEDLQRKLRGETEVYALSMFDGFRGAREWNLIGG